MRHTRAHTGNRRSHHALKADNLAKCSHCGESHRPHHMCLNCGFYNGRQVMDLTSIKAKRDARIKAKHERITNEFGASSDSGVAQTEAVAQAKKLPEAKKTELKAKKVKVAPKHVEKHRESKGS